MPKDESGNDVDDWRRDNERYGHVEDPDGELRLAVGMALIKDGKVDTRAVSVIVIGGVVTLRGSVPAAQKAAVAGQLEGVPGIKAVKDELTAR